MTLGDVARNGFTSPQGAFQVAANGISRHLAGFLQSRTVGTDLAGGRGQGH